MRHAVKGAILAVPVASVIAAEIAAAAWRSPPHGDRSIARSYGIHAFRIAFVVVSLLAVPAGAALGALAARLRRRRLATLTMVMLASVVTVGVAAWLGSPLTIQPWEFLVLLGLVVVPGLPFLPLLEIWTRPSSPPLGQDVRG